MSVDLQSSGRFCPRKIRGAVLSCRYGARGCNSVAAWKQLKSDRKDLSPGINRTCKLRHLETGAVICAEPRHRDGERHRGSHSAVPASAGGQEEEGHRQLLHAVLREAMCSDVLILRLLVRHSVGAWAAPEAQGSPPGATHCGIVRVRAGRRVIQPLGVPPT